jgi:hypothetical protein
MLQPELQSEQGLISGTDMTVVFSREIPDWL